MDLNTLRVPALQAYGWENPLIKKLVRSLESAPDPCVELRLRHLAAAADEDTVYAVPFEACSPQGQRLTALAARFQPDIVFKFWEPAADDELARRINRLFNAVNVRAMPLVHT